MGIPLLLNIAAYPLLSSLESRDCGPCKEICSTFPCEHTECTDADYLQDKEEELRDCRLHKELWECFNSLKDPASTLKAEMSQETWGQHEIKFARCRCLIEKEETIQREIAEKEDRLLKEWEEFEENQREYWDQQDRWDYLEWLQEEEDRRWCEEQQSYDDELT